MAAEGLPKTLKVLDRDQVIEGEGRVVRLVGPDSEEFGVRTPVVVYRKPLDPQEFRKVRESSYLWTVPPKKSGLFERIGELLRPGRRVPTVNL